jgi:hypothetical protein
MAGAFDYAGFIAEETQMTTEHCAKLGQEVSSRASRAKLVYNKKESFESDIKTLRDWRQFDEVAGLYLKDKSKRDLLLSFGGFGALHTRRFFRTFITVLYEQGTDFAMAAGGISSSNWTFMTSNCFADSLYGMVRTVIGAINLCAKMPS